MGIGKPSARNALTDEVEEKKDDEIRVMKHVLKGEEGHGGSTQAHMPHPSLWERRDQSLHRQPSEPRMSLCPTVFSQTEFSGLPDADFEGVKVALSGAHPATSEGPHENGR